MFSGSLVALITPFRHPLIDWCALESLVEWHIQNGTQGIVSCGSTGESWTLSSEEQRRVIEVCVHIASKRIPIIAGTGAVTTEQTIFLTQQAKTAGVDAALIVTPPYIKPTQEGLYHHYKRIQEAVDLPILIYNNPSRAGVTVSLETLVRLAKLPGIVGVKDATGDLCLPTVTRLEIGSQFCQLSGNDDTSLAFLAQGGHGCISVTANIAPQHCAHLHQAWQQGNLEAVRKLRDLLHPLHQALFTETSPGPVKYAASLLGLCLPDLRPPLAAIAPTTQGVVQQVMQTAGLLNSGYQMAG